MRIGIFTDTYAPQINGVVTSIEIFTQQLRKFGHEVFIFAPKVTGKERKEKDVFRFGSMVFPFQPEHRISFPYSPDIPEFSELNIDIVHAQTPFSMGILGLYLAQRYKVPLVYTHHTLYDEYVHYLPILPSEVVKGFTAWASKVYCDRCDLVIAPSISIQDLLLKHGVESEIAVIPTGIDLEEVEKIKPMNLLRHFGLSQNSRSLVFSGRLGKEKGIDFLLEAFQKAISIMPHLHLFIIGDGPEKKNLQQIAKKLGISRKVTFAGYLTREKVIAACKGADLYVFSSTTETQGLAVLEAIAAGTPVVAVDAMGVTDVIQGNMGGFLTSNDMGEFSAKIVELLKDEKLRAKKIIEAKKRAEQLSIKTTTNLLIECYNKALKGRKEI